VGAISVKGRAEYEQCKLGNVEIIRGDHRVRHIKFRGSLVEVIAAICEMDSKIVLNYEDAAYSIFKRTKQYLKHHL
jgi:hypothetical protein